jgi:hypothetical protein
MSSYVQQVMDEPDETPNSTPVEKPVETPQEQPQETPQETPVEPQGQPQGNPPEEQPQETPQEPEKAHKDLSGISKEEKAQFAFRRQLAKQASKYESIIDEMKNTFGKQIEELKAGMNRKPEEPPKTRADFPADAGGDDAYIDYLTQRGVKKELEARDAEARKLQEQQAEHQREIQEAQRAQQELAATFDANTKAAFRDEASYHDFQSKLRRGVQNGLAEILDEAPAVRDYVFSMPEGPVVLNEMLSNKDSFIRVMSRAAMPDIARIEMYELAREIRNRSQVPPQEAPQARNAMPPIGKPGAKQGGSSGSMWDSDEALINFARSHR